MNRSAENRTGFLGTYFDRDITLRVARLAGILAWVLLAFYVYITVLTLAQYWWLVAAGGVSLQGLNIFDRLITPAMQIQMSSLPSGLVYFVMLKVAQQTLLILLDVEDNSRRAARK